MFSGKYFQTIYYQGLKYKIFNELLQLNTKNSTNGFENRKRTQIVFFPKKSNAHLPDILKVIHYD